MLGVAIDSDQRKRLTASPRWERLQDTNPKPKSEESNVLHAMSSPPTLNHVGKLLPSFKSTLGGAICKEAEEVVREECESNIFAMPSKVNPAPLPTTMGSRRGRKRKTEEERDEFWSQRPDWLPEGWTMNVKVRKDGATAGIRDRNSKPTPSSDMVLPPTLEFYSKHLPSFMSGGRINQQSEVGATIIGQDETEETIGIKQPVPANIDGLETIVNNEREEATGRTHQSEIDTEKKGVEKSKSGKKNWLNKRGKREKYNSTI
ncbi:hypothetical protein MRB53_011004 [Persea americana]|uniref:Uncharacterized protein n=1 Tax=Persea americana TaxID=3435 RepID=A0ACC2LUC4_PERAE|nr:hypothetical protein MRB53_011004 [Persea americana]